MAPRSNRDLTLVTGTSPLIKLSPIARARMKCSCPFWTFLSCRIWPIRMDASAWPAGRSDRPAGRPWRAVCAWVRERGAGEQSCSECSHVSVERGFSRCMSVDPVGQTREARGHAGSLPPRRHASVRTMDRARPHGKGSLRIWWVVTRWSHTRHVSVVQ